eukprot:TRINITY_DN952_c0_g1_i1.p1 TRINITY_DN952_c0_g1~~TRINITY_DN952_c0_g1_i1.p1  ORF type:complete len:363 (-),score=67.14 TRINITY_DN952_c0_g1_i1:86-1174(-)
MTSSSLPQKMKALVCYGPGDYRLEEKEVPKPGPGEILVKVTACGICAGDAKCFTGAPMFWGVDNKGGYCQPPVVPGHEFIGRVVTIGEGAKVDSEIQVGDQIISEQIIPCYHCRYCEWGKYWMCNPHDIYGFHKNCHGGMAEYMVFPKGARNYKVPNELSHTEAVFIEPLACAIHAVQRANIELGDTIVISGCGPIGLGMVAAAKLKSPKMIIAVDLFDWKLDIAKRCGADVVLNPTKIDAVEEIKRLTDGYGCDKYIEASGHPSSVKQGLMAIRKLGIFVEFSVFGAETSVDWTIIGDTKQLDIHGVHLSPYCYPLAISMLVKKQLPITEIVSHVLPLEKWREGFDKVTASKDSLKVVLIP